MNTAGIFDASPNDCAALASWLDCSADVGWSSAQLADSASRDNYRLRVIRSGNDSAAGFLLAHFVGPEATLMIMATDPASRRQGLGRKLLQDFASCAAAHACTDLLLEVRAGNAAAIALYVDGGFVESGRRENYYAPLEEGAPREAALLMQRALRAPEE